MMAEKPYIGRWQDAIWQSDLPRTAKVVALAYGSFMNYDNGEDIRPSATTIASYVGITERGARNWLKVLSLLGWFEQIRRPGGHHPGVYRATIPCNHETGWQDLTDEQRAALSRRDLRSVSIAPVARRAVTDDRSNGCDRPVIRDRSGMSRPVTGDTDRSSVTARDRSPVTDDQSRTSPSGPGTGAFGSAPGGARARHQDNGKARRRPSEPDYWDDINGRASGRPDEEDYWDDGK